MREFIGNTGAAIRGEPLPAAGMKVEFDDGIVGRLVYEAMIEEVSVTPKPGLVDKNNSGAHRDMDFSTFARSARVLEPYFAAFAREGAARRGFSPPELFAAVRQVGVRAETAMFVATGGVNTHKGLIFSLGLLSAAAGALYAEGRRPTAAGVCAFAARMSAGIVERDLAAGVMRDTGRPLTKGERLFRDFGIRGIRGEAERGFETVMSSSLPRIRALTARYPGRRNDVLLDVLLGLMSRVNDTNVLGRADGAALEYVQAAAARALALGGPFTESGCRFIEKMDRDFIRRNISPGGSADLLAVTIFLDRLETLFRR